jgi:hypothetical protein
MPNWCRNTLWVNHKNKDRLAKLRVAIAEGRMCNFVIPEPDYKKTPVAKTFPEIQLQFAKTDEEKAKAIANEPTIREDSWWDWRVQNWGTKWDVDMTDEDIYTNDDGSLSISFDSAWSPPIKVFEGLIELGFKIQAEWLESGMGFGGYMNNDSSKDFSLPDGETAEARYKNLLKLCKTDTDYENFVDDWGLKEDYERDLEEEKEEQHESN